ncbi:acyl carrier protein [Chitiniphilus eburneus]|uniref:Acyl carrier protein n=1 Tax=Chitiniphilus eburneus TaxID=2571148 RepID=A0A4U0PDF1_9NEIS|nr:acyl carrier protein [Chitiniphilus eburneus]TJZ65825.1 acyl carrier protein [Chitiniphilus eburneus]
MDKQELLARIQQVLAEQFEIDPARVTPAARLYDDLDIDSIDAVDLVVQLQALVGRRLSPDAFKAVRTVGDVIDALDHLMRS